VRCDDRRKTANGIFNVSAAAVVICIEEWVINAN